MSTENKTAPVITLTAVQQLLADGKDRKAIAEHFGVSQAAMKRKVWSHPALKNRKAMGASNFDFIDDRDGGAVLVEEPVQEAAASTESVGETNGAELAASNEGVSTNAPAAEQAQAAPATNNDEWR